MSAKNDRSYQDKRRQAIEEAAYAVLRDKGYKAASMLAIARKAKASNETLYSWYGNKQKLFGSLVEGNTTDVREFLDTQGKELETVPVVEALTRLGSLLLKVVDSEKAIALNRAATGDVHDTATLGKTIAKSGRETILPMLKALFDRAMASGEINFDKSDKPAEIWVSLLIGDLQIRRVIGARNALTNKEIHQRSARAAQLLKKLFQS